LLIDYLLKGDVVDCCTICGDIDGNGEVEIGDVSLLMDMLIIH